MAFSIYFFQWSILVFRDICTGKVASRSVLNYPQDLMFKPRVSLKCFCYVIPFGSDSQMLAEEIEFKQMKKFLKFERHGGLVILGKVQIRAPCLWKHETPENQKERTYEPHRKFDPQTEVIPLCKKQQKRARLLELPQPRLLQIRVPNAPRQFPMVPAQPCSRNSTELLQLSPQTN